jgi:hypothetical protein
LQYVALKGFIYSLVVTQGVSFHKKGVTVLPYVRFFLILVTFLLANLLYSVLELSLVTILWSLLPGVITAFISLPSAAWLLHAL